MSTIITTKLSSKLILITFFLIIVNFGALAFNDLQIMRTVRLVSICLFLFFYCFISTQRERIFVFILLSLALRETFLFFYETQIGHSIYLALGIFTYAMFCYERRKILKKIVYNPFSSIVTVIAIIANIYTLYVLSEMIQESFVGPFNPVLFYVYGSLMIVLGATAITYNQHYNSNRSLHYVFFAICLILSDVTSLFAYYFGIEFLFYVDRFAFVLGIGFFLYTIIDSSQKAQEMEQYKMLTIDK